MNYPELAGLSRHRADVVPPQVQTVRSGRFTIGMLYYVEILDPLAVKCEARKKGAVTCECIMRSTYLDLKLGGQFLPWRLCGCMKVAGR